MTTARQVMTELKKKGSAQTRKIFARHGAPESMFGVKVADLKVIAKEIKGNQELACELYDTGHPDAQYLAGFVADGGQMTKKQLDSWAKNASWSMVAEYSVPGVVSESPFARALAIKWIKARNASVNSIGWSTYSAVLSVADDQDLDLAEIKELLTRVEQQIDSASDRVKMVMIRFVISVGAFVKPLLKQAKAKAKKLGVVSVDVGETHCKVPVPLAEIEKIEGMGRVGKKRKTAKC